MKLQNYVPAKISLTLIIAILIFVVGLFFYFTKESAVTKTAIPNVKPLIIFVGPGQNLPIDAPKDSRFANFAVVIPKILSRSGQPSIEDFKYLSKNGWKGVVDLRQDGEMGEVSDDSKIPGFDNLNFNYINLQIVDGLTPTVGQAREFLRFVNNPKNQPVHVHCAYGIGRAGLMVALYRYSVQSWPMDKAIEESRLFSGGVDEAQAKWLESWAKDHEPGSFK